MVDKLIMVFRMTRWSMLTVKKGTRLRVVAARDPESHEDKPQNRACYGHGVHLQNSGNNSVLFLSCKPGPIKIQKSLVRLQLKTCGVEPDLASAATASLSFQPT